MPATVTIEAVVAALVLGDCRGHGPELHEIVGSTGFAVVDGAEEPSGTPDLIVLAGDDGSFDERISALQDIVERHPDVPVVIAMPSGATRGQMRRAMRCGASGIVLDHALRETLAPTVAAVAAGQLAVPTCLVRRLAGPALSHREKEVLALVAQGYPNARIATTLFIAESTVKTHLSAALRKLDATSRAEAAALVLDPDEGLGLGVTSLVSAD